MEEQFSKEYIEELSHKIGRGKATMQEEADFEAWYRQQLQKDAELPEAYVTNAEELKHRMFAGIERRLFGEGDRYARILPMWKRIAGVAAAVAAIVVGVWFFNSRFDSSRHSEDTRNLLNIANDIAPGKYGATITLANGEVIELDSAKQGVIVGGAAGLAYSDHTPVISNEERNLLRNEDKRSLGTRDDVVQLTATTAKGQTYAFTLPDGSKVWLNADSKIEFPYSFARSGKRTTILSGEAYFEVAKDKARPFVVKAGKQEVEVLGTHFNVSAYQNEPVLRTTLLEGSVRVSYSGAGIASKASHSGNYDAVVLKPNQQSSLQGELLRVANVDAGEVAAWKDGIFVFSDEPLQTILAKIARWYSVEIDYAPGVDRQALYGGSVSRYDHISEVLKTLELTRDIHFKIEGRRITVMK